MKHCLSYSKICFAIFKQLYKHSCLLFTPQKEYLQENCRDCTKQKMYTTDELQWYTFRTIQRAKILKL